MRYNNPPAYVLNTTAKPHPTDETETIEGDGYQAFVTYAIDKEEGHYVASVAKIEVYGPNAMDFNYNVKDLAASYMQAREELNTDSRNQTVQNNTHLYYVKHGNMYPGPVL